MATIETVLGPVDADKLGFTLPHEHVMETSGGIPHTYPDLVDTGDVVRRGGAALKRVRELGVETIVDLTTFDIGRDVKLLQRVSRESGVNIACSTGTWLDIPRTFLTTGAERVARLFVREIEEGIEGTGIKSAVIKASTDSEGLTPGSELSLRSAAMASVATGAPISTHTWAPGKTGAMQVDIFEREGVDLGRVCIGHCDDTDDVPFLISLLQRGVWLGLDHMSAYGHREGTPNAQTRIETVWKLIEAGYERRILLSHDSWISVGVFTTEQMADKQSGNPDGYSFISLRVLPKLRELGATDEQIETITVDNPRRFLTGAAS